MLPAIIGGLATAYGAHKAQEASRDMARDSMDFSARQAATARQINWKMFRRTKKFNKHMSNTAHRRQMADLRKAGLNPILSGRYGGASTPTVGGIASPSPTGAQGQARNVLGEGVQSGLDIHSQMAQIERVEAETEFTSKKADAISVAAEASSGATKLYHWIRDKLEPEAQELFDQLIGAQSDVTTAGENNDLVKYGNALIRNLNRIGNSFKRATQGDGNTKKKKPLTIEIKKDASAYTTPGGRDDYKDFPLYE